MTMMKNVMCVGLMLLSTVIFAQRKDGHGGRGSNPSEKMKTELSLNDDQYAKIKAINEKFKGSHSKIWGDSTQTIAAARQQQRKLRTDREAEIKKVLTDAQWTKWKELKAKRGEEHKKRMRDRKGK